MAGAVVRTGAVKTTAQTAADHAKANAAAAKKDEGATHTEREKNPGVVRAKNFDLRDPSTGIYIPAGKLTEVPYFSGWMISQIEGGIIELVEGDPEKDRAARQAAHASKVKKAEKDVADAQAAKAAKKAASNSTPPQIPEKNEGEADEDYAKRVEEFKAANNLP
jgi:hypothetical protein